jgi:hypothetical protein
VWPTALKHFPKEVSAVKQLIFCVPALAAILTLGFGARADEKDEKVTLDQVPAVVKDALKARYPKAEVVSAEKGDVDGTKVYEFKLKEGAKEWEVAFTPDGKFHSSEEPLKEADLPAKVKDAFKQKYGEAKVLTIEKETTGDGDKAKVVFEIVFEKGTEKLEAQFDPEGKFLAEEKVKEKKEEVNKDK